MECSLSVCSLAVLCSAFPSHLWPFWCLVPKHLPGTFFLIVPQKFAPRSLYLLTVLRSRWFAVRAFWEFMWRERTVLAAEGIPQEKMYLHHVSWADMSLMCLSSAAHVLCGAKAEAPYPSFALCWARANKLGLLAGCVRSGLLLC